jgi:hypothetical protein
MSRYPDHTIEQAIDGNRWPTANAQIAYRQMLAMEEIALSLASLEEILRHTDPVRLLPPAAADDPEAKWSEPMPEPIEAIGPALQHQVSSTSRRKRFPSTT